MDRRFGETLSLCELYGSFDKLMTVSLSNGLREGKMENIELTDLERALIDLIGTCKGEAQALRRRNLCEQLAHFGDERKIRRMIEHLRRQGVPICSTVRGYFMAQDARDLLRSTDYSDSYALSILTRTARQKKISLPEYLGQLRMKFGGESAEDSTGRSTGSRSSDSPQGDAEGT